MFFLKKEEITKILADRRDRILRSHSTWVYNIQHLLNVRDSDGKETILIIVHKNFS